MQYRLLARVVGEYIGSLSLIIISPKDLIDKRMSKKIPNLALGLVTIILFSTAKYQVVSGIIMFKTLKMLVTMFPQYFFLTYYAGYVNVWGVSLGVVADLLIMLAFTLLFNSSMRLQGIKHGIVGDLVIVGYSWIADTVIIVAGIVALPLDIVSSAITLIIASIISLALKSCIIVNAYVKAYAVKLGSVIASFLITIIVLGLIIIGILMV